MYTWGYGLQMLPAFPVYFIFHKVKSLFKLGQPCPMKKIISIFVFIVHQL